MGDKPNPKPGEQQPESFSAKVESSGDGGAQSSPGTGQKRLNETKEAAKAESEAKERALAVAIAKGNVPALEIAGAPKPLTPDEQRQLHHLQAGLLIDLPFITAGSKKQEAVQINKDAQELKKELEAKTFGPATQALYKRLVDTLTREVGNEVRILGEMNLPLPAGTPLDAKHAGSRKAQVDLKLDTRVIPSWDDFDRMDNLKDWRNSAQKAVIDGKTAAQDHIIEEELQKGHFPKGWLEHQKYNSDAWRNTCTDAILLTQAFGSYTQVADLLNKLDIDPPIAMPPVKEIKRKDDGQIESIDVGLPSHVDTANPATSARFHEMQNWLKENKPEIDKAIVALKGYVKDKDSLLLWGETELKHGKARLDAQGNFLGIAVDEKYKPTTGEHLEACNLLDTKFDVIHRADGKIEVRQTMQAEHAPLFSYHNTIGITKLGNGQPKKIETRTYEPDDYVPVRGLSGIKLIKAKELDSYKAESVSLQSAGKGVPMVMDAAMVVSGAIELRGAIGLIQLSKVAGEQGLKMSLREASWEAAKATTKTIVGLLGALDSAGGKETEWGSKLNTLRNDYFLFDTGKGLIQAPLRTFRSAEEISSAEKLQVFITGAGRNGEELQSALPSLKTPYKLTERAFKFTEYGMAPLIATGLGSAMSTAIDPRADRRLEDIFTLYGKGAKDLAFFEQEKMPMTTHDFTQKLDGYAKVLTADAPSSKIAQMFAKTAGVLQSNDPVQKEKLKQELLQTVASNFFSKQELEELDNAYRSPVNLAMHPERKPLTGNQLIELLDPKEREKYDDKTNPNVALRAWNYSEKLQKFDASERMAALMCLAYVSKGTDNKLPANLGVFSLRDGTAGNEKYSLGVKMDVAIDQAQLVKMVESTLEHGSHSPGEVMAASDFLLSVGAIGARQYAAIGRQVLDDPRSSRELKIALLSGNGLHGFVTNMKTIEAHAKPPKTLEELEQTSGTSAGELREYLQTLATKDKSADVRALAAAEYFASVQENDRTKSFQTTLLRTCQKFDHQVDGKLGIAVNSWLADYVQKKDDPTQPIALVALSLSTGKDSNQFNRTIFDAQAESLNNPTSAVALPFTMDAARFESLQRGNPAATAHFCQEALKMVAVPDPKSKNTQLEEAERIEVIQSLSHLFKQVDTPFKQQFIDHLNKLIDPGSKENRSPIYALYYPKLREAAIEALTEVGARGSEKLVIQQLSADAGMSEMVGSDPRVRLAATRYLEKLDRPALARMSTQIAQSEHDPTVSRELTDFTKFEQNKFKMHALTQKLESHKKALDEDATGPSKTNLDSIFAKTEAAITSDDAGQKEQLKKELLETFAANYFSSQQILRLEISNRRALTNDQLLKLLDPEKRQTFDHEIQTRASNYCKRFDSKERMAALTCLAYLSKSMGDGSATNIGQFRTHHSTGQVEDGLYGPCKDRDIQIDQSCAACLVALSLNKNSSPAQRMAAQELLALIGAEKSHQKAANA